METKSITLTIVFAALTVALNPEITKIAFPAPYAPFLIYQIWEIPIVAAFLLVNLKSSVAITALNTVILFAFFQGASPLGPVYNLVAIFSMLLGVYIARALFAKRFCENANTTLKFMSAMAIIYTVFGVAFRTLVMGVVNYITLRYDPPIGFALQEPAIVSYYLPVTSFFNASLALYTILLAYFVSQAIKRNLRHVTPTKMP